MTAMATLWQGNDGIRPIGALFFEINGIFHFMLSIFIEISKKYSKLFVTLISNPSQKSFTNNKSSQSKKLNLNKYQYN